MYFLMEFPVFQFVLVISCQLKRVCLSSLLYVLVLGNLELDSALEIMVLAVLSRGEQSPLLSW